MTDRLTRAGVLTLRETAKLPLVVQLAEQLIASDEALREIEELADRAYDATTLSRPQVRAISETAHAARLKETRP